MKTSAFILLSAFATASLCNTKDLSENPKYWRAILGDICQLPSFPRATGDPTRYVECVRQSDVSSDRSDLGIWLLRECIPGYEFVASSRRCKTARSIERQQALCDSANSTAYNFCPSKFTASFQIEEMRDAPKQCACPNGELNCVCPTPEILAPVSVTINSEAKRRSPQQYQTQSSNQYQNCPCPPSQPTCFCIQLTTSNQPTLASSTCCSTQSPPIISTTQTPQAYPCPCTPQQLPVEVNCQTTTTQQQYCPTPQRDQPAVIQAQPCSLVQGGVSNAQYQGICSWMVDPLANDPQSRTHYLQCQSATNNLFCGRWQRMPCPKGTIFDVNAQICVLDATAQPPTAAPGTLPPGTLPPVTFAPVTQPPVVRNFGQSQCGCTGGVQIGSCNSNYQCPGQSVCQVGTQNQRPCSVCCYFRKKAKF